MCYVNVNVNVNVVSIVASYSLNFVLCYYTCVISSSSIFRRITERRTTHDTRSRSLLLFFSLFSRGQLTFSSRALLLLTTTAAS